MDPAILCQSERWVAAYKPAGMVVHRSEWCTDARPLLQWVRHEVGERVYPVHRIDRATAGLVVFALSPEGARHWSQQQAMGAVSKHYHAIVRGWIDESGELDYALRGAPELPPVPAMTRWRRLGCTELQIAVGRYPTARYSLVAARPLTGRTHQLRRHFAHLRHPVVGDVRYGDGRHNRAFRELGVCTMMLCSVAMEFRDVDDSVVRFQAPYSQDFARVVEQLAFVGEKTGEV